MTQSVPHDTNPYNMTLMPSDWMYCLQRSSSSFGGGSMPSKGYFSPISSHCRNGSTEEPQIVIYVQKRTASKLQYSTVQAPCLLRGTSAPCAPTAEMAAQKIIEHLRAKKYSQVN